MMDTERRKKSTELRPDPIILLVGIPNIGKSVIFNKLTGLNVSIANYVGTTVEIAYGKIKDEEDILLIDVPGTYTLNATNEAEKIAVEMLAGELTYKGGSIAKHCDSQSESMEETTFSEKPAAIICVVDANSLEPSLYLLLQLLERTVPTVVALNRIDLAEESGYAIDSLRLSHELGVPVVPTVATTGEGVERLRTTVVKTAKNNMTPTNIAPSLEEKPNKDFLWKETERLVKKVTRKTHATPPLKRQEWGDMLVSPWPGVPLAIIILSAAFAITTGLGMGLRQAILLPLFRGLIIPQIVLAVEAVVPAGIIQNILIGNYGFLVKGLEWPFALILPYVLSFYIALSILEDSGYLPRLGCLLDGLLHKVGLHGSGIIPVLLGYGCGIPAIMSTRTLGTLKERKIAVAMICLAVPCIAQTGAFISLLAARSIPVMLAVFAVSMLALIITGVVLDHLLKGSRLPVLMEIPELLLPKGTVVAKKVLTRVKAFVVTGEVPMIGAIGLAAIFYETGVMEKVGAFLSPIVTGWLQLPAEAAVPLVLGILRRELTVLPLLEMELSVVQLFVGAVVALFYVPCIAILAVLAREFDVSTALKMLFLTTSIAFLIGGLFSRLGNLIF